MANKNGLETLVVDNFRGGMTTFQFGNINSGRSYVQTVSGANPFIKPGQLTWNARPEQINSAEDVVTDLIVAGKERLESNTLYVYAIGHTGRLYKIQVNDPNTYDPNYDNPVLLATLSTNSPTFTRGGFMDFFGATEKIYIGHDKGVTSINFDGTGEAFVGMLGSWTQNVPRPIEQFVGKLYIGNGSNIAEIDSTATVTTYTKLSPGFPTNAQVRDIDTDPEGNYISIVVSALALGDITAGTQQVFNSASSDSYIFKWNGTDIGYTSFTTFTSFSLTANTTFGPHQFTFGYDQYGSAVYAPTEKIITMVECEAPLPNAVASTGNIVTWLTPTYFDGILELDLYSWGNFDFEVGYPGYWDLMFINAKSPETDIALCPFQLPISVSALGSSSNGYPNNAYGVSKIYFSTLETSSTTTKYRLYKWVQSSSPDIPITNPLITPFYQTQTQMFSKKVQIKQIRVYGEPWEAGVEFEIDLIGSSGDTIPNGSKVFTAGSNLTVGDDMVSWTPQIAPTYALGLLIQNLGDTNHTINKIEIDYAAGGD